MPTEIRTKDFINLLKRGTAVVGDLTPNNCLLKINRPQSVSLVFFNDKVNGTLICQARSTKPKKKEIFCNLNQINTHVLSGALSTLRRVNGRLQITSAGAKCSIELNPNLEREETFGKLPQVKISLGRSAFTEMLRTLNLDTDIFEYTEDRNIVWKTSEGLFRAGSNDRYSLALFRTGIDSSFSGELTIPISLIELVSRVLPENLLIGWNDEYVRFHSMSGELTFKRASLECDYYPQQDHDKALESVLNMKASTIFNFDASLVWASTKAVSFGARQDADLKIRLHFASGFFQPLVENGVEERSGPRIEVSGDAHVEVVASMKLWCAMIQRLRGKVEMRINKDCILLCDQVRTRFYVLPRIVSRQL